MQGDYEAKYRAKYRADLVAMSLSLTGGDWMRGARVEFLCGARGNLDAPEFLPAGGAVWDLACIGSVVRRP